MPRRRLTLPNRDGSGCQIVYLRAAHPSPARISDVIRLALGAQRTESARGLGPLVARRQIHAVLLTLSYIKERPRDGQPRNVPPKFS
jgi:hypothetical protein